MPGCEHHKCCDEDPAPWFCDSCGIKVCINCADLNNGLCKKCSIKEAEKEAAEEEALYLDTHEDMYDDDPYDDTDPYVEEAI